MSTVIIYDSKYGFTKKCAEYIKEKLPEADIFSLQDQFDIDNYITVYLGSYVDEGKIHKPMRKFIQKNRAILMRKVFKLFCTCIDKDDFSSALQNSLDTELFYHTKYVCPGGEIKYDQLTSKEKKILSKRINVESSKRAFYPKKLEKLIEKD